MFSTNTLSRAHLRETLPSEKVKSLDLVDHTENLRVSPSRVTPIEQESAQDPVCTNLRQVILEGWPGHIHECDPVLRFFLQFRDALIVQGNLVFGRPRLFVPSTHRKEFTSLTHSSHIGLGSRGGGASPTLRVHVLARNECPNEGFRGSV